MQKYFENKRAVIASLVALGAVGAAGYYLLSSGTPSSAAGGAARAGAEGERSTAAKKKNKKKKSSAKKGPLSHGFPTTQDAADAPLYPVINDWNQLKALSEKDVKEISDELKQAGNHAFNKQQYERALELYSQAIRANKNEPVFYSNRAAVWGSIKDYAKVIEDTTEALRLRPDYVKCYARRAVAYEQLKNYREAVMDYTAACILQDFEDDGMGQSVDRVLKAEAEQQVAERGRERVVEFPSANFIRAFLSSYHQRALPDAVAAAAEGTGEWELKLAFDAIEKENLESYKQAFDHIKRAIELGFAAGGAPVEALAYEYLSTFEFLTNDTDEALKNMNNSIKLHTTVPALLKRSALYIELGMLTESDADFSRAEKLDPQSPDLYYQSAQLSFLQQRWDTAIENYKKSIAIDSSFILAHVQLAVTEYRMGQTEKARHRFKQLIAKHPDDSSLYNYYGEILLDLKEVSESIKMFDKAFEVEKAKTGKAINVLPLVNKALAMAQEAQTPTALNQAISTCKQAEALDPLSDVAVGTLAQFALQQGQTEEAIELFERNARLARTPAEQVQAYTFAEAARTQYRIGLERPVVRERLERLSRRAAGRV